MGHGTPDFGQTSGVNTVFQLTDMAELAARLGSVVSFDRRGDVFYIEDMEGGAWNISPSYVGLGSGAYLSLISPMSGRFCYRLVAGSTSSQMSRLGLVVGLPSVRRLGVELASAGGSSEGNLTLTFYIYTGSRLLTAQIKHDDATDTLYYWSADSEWVLFAENVLLPAVNGYWNRWKLVVDATKEEYVRFILNATEYDLKDIAVLASDHSSYAYTHIYFKFISTEGANVSAYVDNIIFTQNEP